MIKKAKDTVTGGQPPGNRKRLIMIALLIGAAVVLVTIGSSEDVALLEYLDLQFLKSQQHTIDAHFATNPLLTSGIYFAVYVLVTAFSLPGAAVMTLAGGAIFGLLWGTVVVSFASTIGATLAFLVSRYLLRDMVQTRFGDNLKAVNDGIEKDGAFYLFTLRMIPLVPLFVINLVMGLTPMRARTFWWVSQVGMLPGTIV